MDGIPFIRGVLYPHREMTDYGTTINAWLAQCKHQSE